MKLAKEWNDKLNELKPIFKNDPELFGKSGCLEYFLIKEFASNTSDMLKYLHDQLQPRGYKRKQKESFTQLCNQILTD